MDSSQISRKLGREWKTVAIVIVMLAFYSMYKVVLPVTTREIKTNIPIPEQKDVEKKEEKKWEYKPQKIYPPEWYEVPKRVDPGCKPKQNLYFLRTHQTGTSSVSNILYRYGQEHNLSFVMYPLKLHLKYPSRLNMRYLEEVRPSNGYNILCQYTRHRKMDILRIMPDGTMFVSLLRHPVDQFLSVFHNYDLKGEIRNLQNHHNPYEEFFRNPKKISLMASDAIFPMLQNSMSFDLGLNPIQFNDDKAVDDFIANVDKDFHLVMILEQLDECLVLFRRLMCWDLEQVIYVKLSVNNDYSASISPEIRQKILEWNAIDLRLYNHFAEKMKRLLAEQDEDFWAEVAELKKINAKFWQQCYNNILPVFDGNKLGYSLHETHAQNTTCKTLATDDFTQTHVIGMKQFKDTLSPSDILMVRNHMQNLRKYNPAMLGWADVHKVLNPDIPADPDTVNEL